MARTQMPDFMAEVSSSDSDWVIRQRARRKSQGLDSPPSPVHDPPSPIPSSSTPAEPEPQSTPPSITTEPLTSDPIPAHITDTEDTPSTASPSSPSAEPDQDADKLCRICYGGVVDEPEQGRLISPCKCKGTMKFVHLGCLNEWRLRSHSRTSFLECDHCHYRYNLARTTWAKRITHEITLTLVTLTLFLLLALLSGFITKILLLFFYSPPPLSSSSSSPEGEPDFLFFLDPSHLKFWRIDWPHLLSGVIFIGFLGFFQLIVSMITGPMGLPRLGWFRTGRDGNMVGGVVFVVMLAIGVVRALWAIYKGVKWYSRLTLERLETAILEVNE
ncbi:hypothetical protein HK097_002548 [Rhizophlyctis rosea]|uniref:RING-CH-type domain-containing protein n=1 Tax=Rhizophlyctis rosea TaxID=64517 RepID=A0AAD5S3B6_9FUNG|nr:hypothetical protein HK097_002548 [Rhizophlyctis rosea]